MRNRALLPGILLFVGLLCLPSGCGRPGRKADYRDVTWAQLGNFAYQPSVTPRMKGPPRPVLVPESIRLLGGQPLRLTGYMMPVEVEGREVRTFVLVRDQQLCCFGRMPAMNEWVLVRTGSSGLVAMNMDEPIVVEGNFEVGEDIEEGAVMSLYRMVADTVMRSEGKPKGWKAN